MRCVYKHKGVVITEKQKNKKNKAAIGALISLCALFFMCSPVEGHALNYPGTEVNNTQEYTLILKERGNKQEQIRASEIGLKYDSNWNFDNSKDSRNPIRWSKELYYDENPKMAVGVTYDKKLLKERVDRLTCFDKKSIVETTNAGFRYTDKGYEVIDEVIGDSVNKNILYDQVVNAILRKQAVVDLEAADCYIKPQYTAKSQRAAEVRDMLNKYASSKIAYTFGEQTEVIDGSIINKWLTVDENFTAVIDGEKVKSYLDTLSNKYNMTGKVRNFVASSGKTINIGSGTYSVVINTAKEVPEIIAIIREGKAVTKEPSYVQATYVEIDLSKQHLWFYKNGSLVVDGDVVTGDLSSGMATPEGAYRLYYKERDVVLRGPGYAAPVDFWMPFNGGIGIHDATWRSRFGGTIYKYDGSHGCINCPYSLAETIYDNIDAGTLIICYY